MTSEWHDQDGDGFYADDELILPSEVAGLSLDDTQTSVSRSFLESDNFERELGSAAVDDPFAEDFQELQRLEIVQLYGEGDFAGRPVVVIYAYRMPSNKNFDYQKLLRYLQKTLDQIVSLDYTLVYFHYGLRSHNKPPLKWLIQAYQMLDRRYKKNLKSLAIVHPTKFVRFVYAVFQPFLSLKFNKKIHHVNYLQELNSEIRVASLNLPQPIIDHDETLRAMSKMPLTTAQVPAQPPRPTQQFGVSLQFILNHNPDCDVPPIVTQLLDFLRTYGMDTEGVFRKSAEVATIRSLQTRINKGEKIDFVNDAQYKDRPLKAIIDASALLKTFFRSMGEPVITNARYPELVQLTNSTGQNKIDLIKTFVRKLPTENYVLLKTINQFLTEVAANSKVNLMDANNLSVVFGPNFTWPTDQQVPITQLNGLNYFCYQLIANYKQIFE